MEYLTQGKICGTVRETILQFCKIINAIGNPPLHSLKLAERLERARICPPIQSERGVRKVMRKSFREAEIEHCRRYLTPSPLRRIRMFCSPGSHTYELSWITGTGTRINLVMPEAILSIRGTHYGSVVMYAEKAGLPEPYEVGTPAPPRNWSRNLNSVRVPLGELLDFLEKYRS
jgi:hypothetical protein